MTRPRILLAAYHFPPSAAVGGLRAARFARLLPEFGWEPFVLSVRESDRDQSEGTDPTRLVGLEGLPIERTPSPPGPITLYARFKGWLLRRSEPLEPGSAATREPACVPGEIVARRETLIQRIKRYLVSLVIWLPDEKKNWAMMAVIPAIRLIRRQKIDCILTSGPPFSVHLVGLAAKIFTGVRWIADFRDPWIDLLPARSSRVRSRLSDRVEVWMEAQVFHWADRVLTTTERMRTLMLERYPELPAGKVVYLPNAIDPGRNSDPVERYVPLTITYAGTLYFDRTPEPLFQALGELVREGGSQLADVRIKLLGNCGHISGVATSDVARRYGMESAVEVIGRVPHAEAIRMMRQSHLLLVLAPPNHELVLPAKVFDYLGTGSKLLALAGEGATADLLRETKAGRCFSPSDVPGLKTYLRELLEGGRYRDLRNDPGLFARFDARTVTGQLVAQLSGSVVNDAGAPLRT